MIKIQLYLCQDGEMDDGNEPDSDDSDDEGK